MKIDSYPVNLDSDHKWETGYYPFPEMSRFLNSHSRIHRPPSHSSFSLLGYLCSIADDSEKIKNLLHTFGKKYRLLIKYIIEHDCSNTHQRHKRTTININRTNFPRAFLRNIIDYYDKI